MIREFIFNGCKKLKDDEVVLMKYNWLKDQFKNYVSGLNDAAVYEHMGIADLRVHQKRVIPCRPLCFCRIEWPDRWRSIPLLRIHLVLQVF